MNGQASDYLRAIGELGRRLEKMQQEYEEWCTAENIHVGAYVERAIIHTPDGKAGVFVATDDWYVWE